MKSIYDVMFNRMKYSSVRLLGAVLTLIVTAFVIFESVTNYFEAHPPGKYVALGLFVLYLVTIVFMSIAVEKYPQFDRDNEKYLRLRVKVVLPLIIILFLYIIGLFAFGWTFDIGRMLLPVLCVLGTVYEFYLYFMSRQSEKGKGDMRKQG